MDDWQIKHINKNLVKLLSWTKCTRPLLAKLQAQGIFGDDDIQEITCEKTPNGRAAVLYEILKTRRNAYNALVRALIETKQTGAMELLLEIPTDKINKLQVSFLGNISSVDSLLNPDQIRSIQLWLQNNASLEERLKVHEDVLNKNKTVQLLLNTIPGKYPLYISRLLFRQIVHPKLFERKCSDIFVFKNVEGAYLRNFVFSYGIENSSSQLLRLKLTARFMILDVESNWKNICAKVNSPVHLIRYDGVTQNFILEQTLGNSDILRQHIKHNKRCDFEKKNIPKTQSVEIPNREDNYVKISEVDHLEIEEDKFIKSILTTNVKYVCICDLPGMGKTFLLRSLARKMTAYCPDRIVLFVQLQNFKLSRNPGENIRESLLAELLEQFATSQLSQRILTELVTSKSTKFELFFDGLDEVQENELESTISFLKKLAESIPEARVFVTLRPVVRARLEAALGIIAYDITPFNTETQLRFLTTHWAQTAHDLDAIRLNEYAIFCLKSFQGFLKEKERNITGTPLQCKLIADVYGGNARVYADKRCKVSLQLSRNTISSLLEIYSKFMVRQLGNRKCNFDCLYERTEARCRKKCQVRNFYVWQALKLVFPKLASQLSKHIVSFANLSLHKILKPGVLKENQAKSSFEFLHRTFAEYLVAEFFWKGVFLHPKKSIQTQGQFCVEQLALNEIYGVRSGWYNIRESVVAYFLDCMISESQQRNKTLELHCTAIMSPLNNTYFKILQSCMISDYEGLLELFLKATENDKRKRKTRRTGVLCPSGKATNTKVTTQWKNEKGKYEPIKMTTEIASTILETAAENCCAEKFDRIFKFFLEILDIDLYECVWPQPPPIMTAINRADYELVHYFAVRMNLENQGLVYECLRASYQDNDQILVKKFEILRLILSICPNLKGELWKYGSVVYNSPIHAINCSLKVLKFLAEEGYNILLLNDKGNSVLHSAAEYMSDDDFFELCRFICYDCKAKKYFLNPANWVAYTENFIAWDKKRQTKSLLRILSSLEIEKTFVKKIPSLVQYGIYENYKQVFHSLLYAAFRKTNVEFADLILSYDKSLLDLKCYRKIVHNSDTDFMTATHYSVKYKKLKMFEFFVSRGADVFATYPSQETILHMAAKTMNCDFFHEVLCILGKKWNEVENLEDWDCEAATSENATLENLFKLFQWHPRSLKFETPLHYAMKYLKDLKLETLDLLLSCGWHKGYQNDEYTSVDINATNLSGETALHTALWKGQPLVLVEHLIRRGADWTLKDGHGRNVAHICTEKGLVDHLNYFVGLGCDVNQPDNEGNTAL